MNVVTLVGIVAASYGYEVTPELAGAALVIINVVMRAVTSEPLER